MAITPVATAEIAANTTLAINCAGANYLVVCVTGADSVTAVTSLAFNGDAMTKAVEAISGTDQFAQIWVRANPDQGNYNIVANSAADITARAYSGVDTTTGVVNTAITAFDLAKVYNIVLGSIVSGDLMLGVLSTRHAEEISVTAGTEIGSPGLSSFFAYRESTSTSQTISFATTTTAYLKGVAIALRPLYTNIGKVSGVPYANIGKVSGVPIANIGKISGVA